MKKNNLQSLFPEISETAIASLPEDLTVCWYPSSGPGAIQSSRFSGNDRCSGYCAIQHWETQPSILKPNLYIFSDIEGFEIPTTYELVFSTDFNKILNYEKEELIHPDDIEYDEVSEIFRVLGVDQEIYNRRKAEIEKEYFEQLSKIHLIKKENLFVLLIRCENEVLYQRFIQNNIQIPLLTLNRPMDEFIHNSGIDLDLLGVQELIASDTDSRYLTINNDFQIHPEFVFESYEGYADFANLYSRVKVT